MSLKKLGQKLVKCNLRCEGITIDRKKGIVPRGLIYEKRKGKNKVIVVGLNPGKCKKEQKEYYLENGLAFETEQNYFKNSKLNSAPYFKRTRIMMDLLGFDGDILWSDLAKCQCSGKNGRLPVHTLRVCINEFLRKEVKIFKTTTIFALGNTAFEFCALSFPDHFIIGLPHPSGSFGDFYRLNTKVNKNLKFYKKEISRREDSNKMFKAIHLSRLRQK